MPGCSGSFRKGEIDLEKQTKLLDKPAATGTQVKVDGNGVALGEAERAALSPAELLAKADELLQAQRITSLRWLVWRYPDVAEELLRAGVTPANSQRVLAVAQLHDQQCSPGGSDTGWFAVLRGQAEHADQDGGYFAARREFWDLLRNGRVDDALRLNLPKTLGDRPPGLLLIDAWQLTGTAQLLADQPKPARDAFRRAADVASREQPFQAAHLLLLLSEAQRRTGDGEAAAKTWQQAVDTGSRLVLRQPPVHDPIFWERAIYLRPTKTSWPATAIERLQQAYAEGKRVTGKGPTAAPWVGPADETLVQACIGKWRLDRSEPQAALVAFKRAESQLSDTALRDQLQLDQARVLMHLHQEAAASAILLRLAGQASNAPLSRSAMSLLGTLKLRGGQVQQGHNLLKRAVEQDEAGVWPGRASAEADLGLACLMLGEETAGCKWLHKAQQHFEAAEEVEQLLVSLDNEAKFLEQAKKAKLAAPLRARIATLEQGR